MIESFGASGELSGLDFPKLLIYLHDISFEGRLIINIYEYTKSIFMSKGTIAYVISNDPRDALDTVIVKYGMLSADKFKEAVESAKAQQKTVAKYLIQSGLLASEDLIQASGLQIKEVIKNLITSDIFSYFMKKDITPENVPNQKVNPYQVVFDSIIEVEDMNWVHSQLGSSKRIFAQADAFVDRYKNILYSEETDLIVTRIDGKTDIDTLINISGLQPEKVKKILAALFVLNVLKLVRDSPIGTAQPVTLKKEDTDTQQMASEGIQKRVEQAAQQTLKTSTQTEKDKLGEYLKKDSAELQGGKAPSLGATGIKSGQEEITTAKDITPGMAADGQPSEQKSGLVEGIREPVISYHQVKTSTDRYMKMLERQRKKTSRVTWITFILFILFGATAYFYFFIYLKNIEMDQASFNKKAATQPAVISRTSVPPAKTPITRPKSTAADKKPIVKESTAEKKAILKTEMQPNMKNQSSLMRSGDYYNAAKAWEASFSKNRNYYTIVVEIACSKESVTKIYGYDTKLENLFLLPKEMQGKSCYRICWGLYPDLATAQNKMNTLPPYCLNQTPTPKPFQLKTLY